MNGELKRSHITPKLTGDHDAMVAAQRAEFDQARKEIGAALARTEDFGNRRLLLRQLKYIDAIDPAQQAKLARLAEAGGEAANDVAGSAVDDALLRARGEGVVNGTDYLKENYPRIDSVRGAFDGLSPAEAEAVATGKAAAPGGKKLPPIEISAFDDGTGRVALQDGRHRLLAAREAGAENIAAKVKRYDAEGNLLSETDEIWPLGPAKAAAPAKATADDAADAFIALDRLKRAMQKDVKALRSAGSRSGNALEQMQSRGLADYLEKAQERVRSGLEDSSLWGEAGNAQKAINAKWGEFIRTQGTFRDGFLRKVEGSDYHTGRPVFRVDPDKVASYIRKTGRQEGALVDEYFRRHIDAREALAKEISGAFETSGDEAARLAKTTSSIKATLAGLDETARAVNQVQAIMEAEGSSGATSLGAILGGVLGGAPGAAIGGAIGAVTKPGTMIRQAAAIEQLARNIDLKITRGIGDFFERTANPVRAMLPQASRAAGALASKARPIPTVTALELFRGKEADNQKAYKKRAREVLAATENFGAGVRASSAEALGDLPSRTPRVAQAMVVAATRGAEFLKSKLPAPLVNARSLTPKSQPLVVSDLEIAKFARYWSAVSSPLSVLDDLRRGTVAPEQVEALRVVYPKLYQTMQDGVRTKLMELDERGVIVPYQARLQLDLLLNLDGAGEPTATVDFMVRFQGLVKQDPSGGGQPQPQPPARPVQLASRLRSGTDAIDSSQGRP